MQYIDEKFKECDPKTTVANIQKILDALGISVQETWNDSGLENCWSLSVTAEGGVPYANGKGVSKEFARASAYAEFIERIQGGLVFYKYQSIIRDEKLNFHRFAPDAKYMTEQELVEEGDWMDPIIAAYPGDLTREKLAKQCRIFDCADDGRILMLPFYSLFEDRYVYLPISFVDQVFATNGCCAGNSRQEAWVHALSEMMERRASLDIITGGKALPAIPREALKKYRTVSKILEEIDRCGDFDVEIFDASIGNGFPVISARIINKKIQAYKVNMAADPVFEIALERTLTEIFQGANVRNFRSAHTGTVLGQLSEFPMHSNVINQIETASGLYTADYFANELTCQAAPTDFADNSEKTNQELLQYMLGLYKALGKPVYVRNFSYLGFHSYRFVVPGFSEAFPTKLGSASTEFGIGDQVSKILKDLTKANPAELNLFLAYSKMIATTYSRFHNFGRLAGLPMSNSVNHFLSGVSRAYASYRLGKLGDAVKYCDLIIKANGQNGQYFACAKMYMQLKQKNVEEAKIRSILKKFFADDCTDPLFVQLDQGKTPFDPYLVRCDKVCDGSCGYAEFCKYRQCERIVAVAAERYQNFTDGQDMLR